ncbi:MAG: Regulatory protein RecX [Chlamydiia bacterium]|nr:Regulatory protein RecX [Chlamydiia bacterium]
MKEIKEKKKIGIYKAATNLLARKAYLSFELSDKLKMKGYKSSEIKKTLAELTRYGYISDVKVLESRIKKLATSYGPKLIKAKLNYELRGRGFDIDSMVADLVTDEMQKDAIHKRAKGALDMESKRKLLSSFLRKGFSRDLCLRELDMESFFF